jgi:hypothetical protein
MKGNFSRDSFNRLKHFRRVLIQQGRVQLDADWNEQISILLHYIQTLAADIIGPYAGPEGKDYGFEIKAKANGSDFDFTIGKGRYYVNGILCENHSDTSYLDQPDFPDPDNLKNTGTYVVYLDVWERHITFLEDDDIREKALGGPDTATRAKTVWQVKVKELISDSCLSGAALLDKEIVISNACLCARAKRDQEQVEPCLVEPEARYRGAENQLYRVEIHDGSYNSQGNPTNPTFKWSRENGSVAFPIKPNGIKAIGTEPITLELESLGRDDRFGLAVNDWVEIEDNVSVLNNMARPLLQVTNVDRFEMTVTLQKKAGSDFTIDSGKHALLRRWDQKKDVTEVGVLEIIDPKDPEKDLELENGIKIQFQYNPEETYYRTGDYWLIPARTALGDVEWPENDESKPKSLPPHGVMHHFAPLAIISVSNGTVEVEHDCRCEFKPRSYDCSYSYYGQLGIGIGVDLLCPE